MLASGVRKVTIAWLKQNSGSYALKGIRVEENGQSYDSSITFRDADAEWVTRALGAEVDIEYPGVYGSSRSPQDTPKWAQDMKAPAQQSREESFEVERAGASLLRVRLVQLIQACENDFAGTNLVKQLNDAKNALLTTDAGTQHEIAEATAILSAARKRKA